VKKKFKKKIKHWNYIWWCSQLWWGISRGGDKSHMVKSKQVSSLNHQVSSQVSSCSSVKSSKSSQGFTL